MDEENSGKYELIKKYSQVIERVLVDAGNPKENAREMAYHLAEILPDFEAISEKIKEDKLTQDDVVDVIVHVPYHIDGLVKKWGE